MCTYQCNCAGPSSEGPSLRFPVASVGFSHVLIGFTAVRSENRPTALAPCCNLFHFHKVPIYFRRAIQFVETILALK